MSKGTLNRIVIEDIEDFYAVGDIHGEYETLLYHLKWAQLKNSVVICAGDCGMGFSSVEGTKQHLAKLRNYCNKNNVHVFFVRGNHDDPKYYSQKLINYPNVKCIPDYTVITKMVNGVVEDNILCVGGATSIDRNHRLKGMYEDKLKYLKYHPLATYEEADTHVRQTYWGDERPVFCPEKLDEIKENGIEITVVCTHTCPSFCVPLTKDGIEGWLEADPTLNECITQERATMDSIHEKLNADGHHVRKWMYGHYHFHASEVIDGILYTLLDMCRGVRCDMCRI